MQKNHTTYCPTKDKDITLVVNYSDGYSLEDATPLYEKGRISSCTGMQGAPCRSCPIYNNLPQKTKC